LRGGVSLAKENVLQCIQYHERRLSVDWKKIKAEYIAGGTSYRKLAEKHGVSFNTLKTHAVDEQWHKLRQQKDEKVTTKMVETISDKDAQDAVSIIGVADKLLDKIYEMLNADVTNAQSIKSLTSALKDLKEVKGFKSDADMREQEARIKKLQKEAQEDDNTLTEIKVTFGSDDSEDGEKWAE
jgi:lambda repressor-like predicted transcriptional regulator